MTVIDCANGCRINGLLLCIHAALLVLARGGCLLFLHSCICWQHQVQMLLFVLSYCCSKAAHRVATLMQEHFGMADVTEQSPRLFASLLPPEEKKVEALR